jgi:predicted ATPase/DNA-binding winged helix-turn-helix (wHTH) protein
MQYIGRQTHLSSAAEDAVSFGPFRLHVAKRRLEKNGCPIHLSARAFNILIALVERAGTVVSKNDLLASVWPDSSADESSLRVHVAILRKALGDGEAGARYLATISGQGYCFVARLSRPNDPRGPKTGPAPEQMQSLPARPKQLAGRDQTVHEISEKLRSERFITIVGPGGIGKTTLAVSVGHGLLTEFSDALHFFDLGAIRDSTLVTDVITSRLGLFGRSQNPLNDLVAFLYDKRVLLILDCCEHVIETVAALAERLYREAPQLHIMATSREPLRVEGEHIHRLGPLACPPDNAGLTAAQALTYPAVQVFVERAIANGSQFELNDENAPVVGEICRRLDGIALAIELAAGRANIYGVTQTIALLDDQFKLLWEGRRTALPRHQTLRATLDWSYNLLSELERATLCRLSVFAGTFTLEAARAVAATNESDDMQTMAVLENLIEKSILSVSTSNALTRYRLLDTTRTYALEKLNADFDADAAARRHALYFLQLLEEFGNGTSPKFRNFATIADQFGNIRAALTWCFSERGDRATSVALAAASVPLFLEVSLLTECQLWATRAIEALDPVNANIEHDLSLHSALGLAQMLALGNTDEVGSSLTRALRLAKQIGDRFKQVRLIERLHMYHFRLGNFPEALELARQGEAVAVEDGDPILLAYMQLALGVSYHIAGDGSLARSYLEGALSRLSGSEAAASDQLNFDHLSRARITLARILWLQGSPDQASRLARQALADTIRMDHPVKLSMAVLWAFSIFFWNSELEWFEEYIDRLLLETSKHSLGPYQVIGQAAKGAILIRKGQVEPGIILLRRSHEAMRGHRYGLLTDYIISLAEGLAATGRYEEALDTIDQAIARVEHNRNLVSRPELLRVKSEILISAKNPDLLQAEHLLREAFDLASTQSCLGWELRIATSLAKLWLLQGRRDEARAALAPALGRFSEGFDRHDFKAASELLSALSSPHPNS